MTVVLMSMANALNILSIQLLCHLLFGIPILLFQNLQLVGLRPVDNFLKFFLQFLLLPIAFNGYWLKRTKHAAVRPRAIGASSRPGRLFAAYMLLSIAALLAAIALSSFCAVG